MGGYDQGLLLAQAAVGAPRFRCIAPSRPGYLGTPFGADRTPEAQADRCAALLDTLGVESAAVVAISGGGQCALEFALRHSRRCRALVMISACSAQLTAPVPFRFQIVKFMFRIPWLAERLRKKAAQNPEAAARQSIPDPAVRARTLADPEAGPQCAHCRRAPCSAYPSACPA